MTQNQDNVPSIGKLFSIKSKLFSQPYDYQYHKNMIY